MLNFPKFRPNNFFGGYSSAIIYLYNKLTEIYVFYWEKKTIDDLKLQLIRLKNIQSAVKLVGSFNLSPSISTKTLELACKKNLVDQEINKLKLDGKLDQTSRQTLGKSQYNLKKQLASKELIGLDFTTCNPTVIIPIINFVGAIMDTKKEHLKQINIVNRITLLEQILVKKENECTLSELPNT